MRIHRTGRHIGAIIASTALITALAACGSETGSLDTDNDVGVVATDVAGVVDSALDRAESEVTDLAQALRDEGLDNVAGVVEQIDVSELVGDGEFTFLAPADDAFTALTADQMADLLTNPAEILDTLRNHVLDGTYTAADLAGMDTVETRSGESLPVSVEGETVTIGDVTVTKTDISFGNGVIHVVDGFLLSS